MSPIPHSYNYQRASSFDRHGTELEVVLAASSSPSLGLTSLSGRLAYPAVAAQMLLTVDQVATTSFCSPSDEDAPASPHEATPDPIVSSSATGIRFESFSECGGVYARFDLDASAFDGDLPEAGSASIHLNQELRSALASVDETSSTTMRIGPTSADRPDSPASNPATRVISLSNRWIRGFSEAAVAASTMEPNIKIRNTDIQTFLSGLPTGQARTPLWIEPSGFSLRFSTRPSRRATRAGGVARLRRLRSFAPLVRSLTVFGDPSRTNGPDAGSTVWLFEVDGGRLSIALSPSSSRAFAGGLDLLRSLKETDPAGPSGQIRHLEQALAGRLGYDASTASWFKRVLPFDLDALAEPTAQSADL